MPTTPHIWLNGTILPLSQATVSPLDPGLTLGHGVFETLLAPDGTSPFNFAAHHQRLTQGFSNWNSKLPDETTLLSATEALLEKEQLQQKRTRIRITATPESLSIIAYPIDPLSETLPTIKAQAFSPYRRNEHSPLLNQKSLSYAENSLALKHAQETGYDEALLLNTSGHLCEATTANLFLVKNNILLTPSLDSGCLPGTTRELILKIASSQGIQTQQISLSPDDYHQADEAFLTNAIRGVQSIKTLGPLSQKLQQSLIKLQTVS